MVQKHKVTPGLTEKTNAWYKSNFENVNHGAAYTLEAMPELYGRTLRDLRGMFSAGELSLMLDVQNGCFLSPVAAGQHLTANVEDGIALDRQDQKWKIDGAELVKKLHALKPFEIAMLEIWAGAFWCQDKSEIEKWVSGLAGEEKKKK